MKKLKIVSILSFSAFLLMGCGKSMTGSYNLSETLVSQNGTVNSSCTTSQLSMTMIQSGKNISGNAVGSCYSESLAGSDQGNSQYSVNLTMVPSAQYGSYGQNCTYAGTLSVQNNQITGTLILQQAQAQTTTNGQPTTTSYSYCSTTVTISGSLQ